jgi:Na+-driven multidrug efflux pump
VATSIGFVSLTVMGILIFIFARQLSTVFIPGDIETIRMSAEFTRIMALTFGFIAIHHVLNGAFIGSGNTYIPMTLAFVSLWVLRFPVAYILSNHTALAEVGIWIAFPVANVITALITAVWFLRGTWKKRRITEEIKLSTKTTRETIIEEGLPT